MSESVIPFLDHAELHGEGETLRIQDRHRFYYRIRLYEVNEAIRKAEASQSYSIEGRSLQRAQIDPLYRERARLEPLAAKEAAADSGPAISKVVFSTSKGL